MPIDVRQLRFAVLTADNRSFSRAAAALNIKQSTLSRKVMQLEERLGVKLFERTTCGAQPTKNGRAFIEQARRIVTDVDNLRTTADAVSYGEHGRIAVGFSSSLMAGKLKLAFVSIFVPYSHCNEPKTLTYSMQPICLLNADGGYGPPPPLSTD